MSTATIFFSTFFLVFINELGDKTQIVAGTGTLANQTKTRIIFLSSALALVLVAGLTVFFAGLIPEKVIPSIVTAGGGMLVLYGFWLYFQAGYADYGEEVSFKNGWLLFASHFSVVFIAELADKTQFATLAAALTNRSNLYTVFVASSSALVTVTLITVWGAPQIPLHWVKTVQRFGAVLMVLYGVSMIL